MWREGSAGRIACHARALAAARRTNRQRMLRGWSGLDRLLWNSIESRCTSMRLELVVSRTVQRSMEMWRDSTRDRGNAGADDDVLRTCGSGAHRQRVSFELRRFRSVRSIKRDASMLLSDRLLHVRERMQGHGRPRECVRVALLQEPARDARRWMSGQHSRAGYSMRRGADVHVWLGARHLRQREGRVRRRQMVTGDEVGRPVVIIA